METCDTTMEHEKKEDTTIYVLGSTPEINTKRYTRRIMIMSSKSSFISYGGDKFGTFLLLKQLLWMEKTGKVENLFDCGGRLISLDFRFYKTKKIVQTYVLG